MRYNIIGFIFLKGYRINLFKDKVIFRYLRGGSLWFNWRFVNNLVLV